jgi:hypothetical protein
MAGASRNYSHESETSRRVSPSRWVVELLDESAMPVTQSAVNRVVFRLLLLRRLPGTPLKVSDSRTVIGYATLTSSATFFFEAVLASAVSSDGISR